MLLFFSLIVTVPNLCILWAYDNIMGELLKLNSEQCFVFKVR